MINGLDISEYQEDQGRLINWTDLAKDERKFKFIWIKASEGEIMPEDKDAYPVNIFRRQMDGAASIGLSKAPYHFYYFHTYIGDGKYYTLSPYKQADAFRKAAMGYEGDIPPLCDLEDPYIYRPVNLLDFHDNTTANAALSLARLICNRVRQYLSEVERLFMKRPVVYTGAWWWNPWAKLVNYYRPEEIEWAKSYNYYLADYTHAEPDLCIAGGQVIAHQYTSTPLKPVNGIINAPNNVDMAHWMLSESEYAIWSGTSVLLTLEERVSKLEMRVDQLESGHG